MFAPLLTQLASLGAPCKGGSFLNFPTWYEYLPGQYDSKGVCSPALGSLGDVWLIVAAIIEILLRIAALVAVAFIIFGAVSYMTSSGDPEKTSRARGALTDALVGLAIAVLASAVVGFVAGHVAK